MSTTLKPTTRVKNAKLRASRRKTANTPNDYRVMGRWGNKADEFLITMASSYDEGLSRIPGALSGHETRVINRLGSVWIEKWKNGAWETVDVVSLTKVRTMVARERAAEKARRAID